MSPKKKKAPEGELPQNARLPGDSSTDAPPPKPIIGIPGNVNIAGGNITMHQTTTGLRAQEIDQLFDQIYTAIERHQAVSKADKEDLKAEVREIQSTIIEAARTNEKVDEGFLSRRFRNIARMAPDVLDVILATLPNPLGGLGVAVKRIGEEAKAESRMPGDSTTDAPPPKKMEKGKGKKR